MSTCSKNSITTTKQFDKANLLIKRCFARLKICLCLFILFQNGSQPAITCLKLTIETLQQGVKYVQCYQQRYQNDGRRRSGIFIVNFEHILHLVLVFLLLTLSM